MEKSEEQGLYIISVAASLAEVHPQTLRMYERKGLLRPARTKNRRRYSDSDIDRLKRIHELTQEEGLNLSGVKKVLEMEDQMNAMRSRMEDLQKQVEEMHSEMLEGMRRMKQSVALSRQSPTQLVIRRKR